MYESPNHAGLSVEQANFVVLTLRPILYEFCCENVEPNGHNVQALVHRHDGRLAFDLNGFLYETPLTIGALYGLPTGTLTMLMADAIKYALTDDNVGPIRQPPKPRYTGDDPSPEPEEPETGSGGKDAVETVDAISLLNDLEISKRLKVRHTVFRRMVKKGTAPQPFAHIGKEPRWNENEVNRWIAAGCPPLERLSKEGT